MAKAWKVVRRTRSGRLKSMLYPPHAEEHWQVPGWGPWTDVEYVPGEPTVAPYEGAPLFVCRSLWEAHEWAECHGGEVWRCDARSSGDGFIRRALRLALSTVLRSESGQPTIVREVTLIERVEEA